MFRQLSVAVTLRSALQNNFELQNFSISLLYLFAFFAQKEFFWSEMTFYTPFWETSTQSPRERNLIKKIATTLETWKWFVYKYGSKTILKTNVICEKMLVVWCDHLLKEFVRIHKSCRKLPNELDLENRLFIGMNRKISVENTFLKIRTLICTI